MSDGLLPDGCHLYTHRRFALLIRSAMMGKRGEDMQIKVSWVSESAGDRVHERFVSLGCRSSIHTLGL